MRFRVFLLCYRGHTGVTWFGTCLSFEISFDVSFDEQFARWFLNLFPLLPRPHIGGGGLVTGALISCFGPLQPPPPSTLPPGPLQHYWTHYMASTQSLSN